MPAPRSCPECGGERVEAKLKGQVCLSKPDAFLWTYLSGSSLSALVCINCGHTTFYADELHKLVERQPEG